MNNLVDVVGYDQWRWISRALAALKTVGLTYPGLRQDRVWVHEGQVTGKI